MNEKELQSAVERIILTELARLGEPFVPVVSSNRHCHLSQKDVEALFGEGYQLTRLRDLSQPGQFACNEQVTIETEKGKMKLRVVGPARRETQVELAQTDAVKLGLRPPLRMSGELENTPGCVLSSGERRVTIPRGVIVAARHLHLSPEEAEAYGLADGDVVSLKVEGPRPCVMENVVVRSGPGHRLEVHVDTDEANACLLKSGQLCRVIRGTQAAPAAGALTAALGRAPAPAVPRAEPKPEAKRETMLDVSREPRRLITEDDVRQAARDGYKIIRYGKDAILTPLARDTAYEKGIELAEAV
ncbi:MAG: phosphate propanoyltransferase [Clostridia bacterium]|nr:phosphate propanoyltransferase [Clostridia bacterium]